MYYQTQELSEAIDFTASKKEFEKNGVEKDMTTYAKMICKNTVEREILEIQEIYLKKIDSEHLNSN